VCDDLFVLMHNFTKIIWNAHDCIFVSRCLPRGVCLAVFASRCLPRGVCLAVFASRCL
jgi:hypothetical protein